MTFSSLFWLVQIFIIIIKVNLLLMQNFITLKDLLNCTFILYFSYIILFCTQKWANNWVFNLNPALKLLPLQHMLYGLYGSICTNARPTAARGVHFDQTLIFISVWKMQNAIRGFTESIITYLVNFKFRDGYLVCSTYYARNFLWTTEL